MRNRFDLEQDIVTLIEEFLDIVPKAEQKQMERLERLAPGLVHFDRFTEASNETDIDFFSVDRERAMEPSSVLLQKDRGLRKRLR